MPPGVVGVDVGNSVGFHEHCKDVGLHPRGVGYHEIHIGTDIGLGILQLGIPVALIRVLVKALCVGIVQLRVILHFIGAAVHRNECAGFVGSILEHFVLPVYIGIDEGIAAILELLQFCGGISRSIAVVRLGNIQRICIVVGAHHLGHFRVELDLAGGSGLQVETASGLAPFCLDKENAVDSLVAIKSHGCGIPENGYAFHLFNRNTVDGAFNAVHKYENVTFTGGLNATDVEGGSPALFSLETGVLDSCKAQKLSVESIGKADCRGAAEFFSGNGICGRGSKEFRTLEAIAQIHLL